jgi:hypothetical protein
MWKWLRHKMLPYRYYFMLLTREFCFADQDATKSDEADIAVEFYCSNRIELKPITVHPKIVSYIGSPVSHMSTRMQNVSHTSL